MKDSLHVHLNIEGTSKLIDIHFIVVLNLHYYLQFNEQLILK